MRPGRVVGEARAFLMELRLDEGPLGAEEAEKRLRLGRPAANCPEPDFRLFLDGCPQGGTHADAQPSCCRNSVSR